MNIFEFIKEKSADERRALAKLIWPKMGKDSQYVSITRLANGRIKTIRLSWIRVICDRYNITPNQLFGFPWKKKVILTKPVIKKKEL